MGDKRRVSLNVWVHYDSETGYVWPQVYGTPEAAYLDERMNAPLKTLKLASEPYTSRIHAGACSFGTEVLASKHSDLRTQLATAQARVKELEYVLEGRHHRYCDWNFTKCECGLDEALSQPPTANQERSDE